jgi:alkylation response protein AidB-like acyl-CoA dehydrogenase
MNLHYSVEEVALRNEVRAFLREALPPDIRRKMVAGQVLKKEDIVRWQRILNRKGWGVPLWPREWGGTGWSPVQQYIFREETYAAFAPEPHIQNLALVGPVLIEFGTPAQREFFLPRIANMDVWFCQGFSEPNAGSDLASLRTKAVRDGDEYVVTGQKMWTSGASHADWMFCLARTDPAARKQKGISYLLIDMKSPGVTVRPISTLDGCPRTNEVFLDEVRVPVRNLVGEENRGWDYAKFLLGNERMFTARIGLSKARLQLARDLALRVIEGDTPLADTSRFLEKAAAIEADLLALEITNLRVVDAATRSQSAHQQDPKASILKLKGAELHQATTELLLEVIGPHVLPRQVEYFLGATDRTIGPEWAATIASEYLYGRAATIYGGSNEIQRNIVSKNILGL